MKVWIEATRPKTLIISIAPILIGTVLSPKVHWITLFLTLICGLSIQIGTNFANDYFDYKQGSDTKERQGPRRLIPAGIISERAMLRALIIAFMFAFLAGLYLTAIGGWGIFVLLLLAIGSGIGYSMGRLSLSRTGLADLFVFVFFGPVAVLSTYYLQTGAIDWMLLWASMAPGLIPVAVLTANNLRDRLEDKKCHKRTLTVRFGKKFGQWQYTLCLLGGILAIIPLLKMQLTLIITLAALIPSFTTITTVWTYKQSQELIAVLAGTGKILLVYTFLFILGALI